MKRLICAVLVVVSVLTSCNDLRRPDSYKTKVEIEYEQAWTDVLGEVDPEQTWVTSSHVSLEIKGAGASSVKIYTLGEEQRSLLASRDLYSDAVISFDVPDGLDKGIAVCRETPDGTEYRYVSKAGLKNGRASVSFVEEGTKAGTPITAENKAALTRATCKTDSGQRAEIFGYTTFPAWIWADMNAAIPENKSAVLSNQITNFEMKSNGPFYVATVYGSTGNSSVEVGYYYYTEGASVESATFVPIVDAIAADYYYDEIHYTAETALPKVEWQSKEDWQWTPANFCFYDQLDGMKSNSFKTRAGDNQFNTYWLEKKYGNDDPDKSSIAQIRGLTFKIDAPKGAMVGFYCQKPNNAKNHTTSSMNRNNYNAAAIKVYDGFRFIGLEDGTSSGSTEPDCNDIALIMVPGNDGRLPSLLPYIKDITDDKYYNGDGTKTEEPKYDVETDGGDEKYEELLSSKKQVWTLAFEDMASVGDFDFNDVVITITPDDEKRSAKVTLCATGGAINSYLYYGDRLIGEVHELLGSVENGKNVLANTYFQNYRMVDIFEFDMEPGHKIEDEARNFKLIVGSNVITLPQKGEVPKAILVPGFWAWPKEAVRISEAYPEFGEWGHNYHNDNFKAWYKKPAEDKTVKF